MIPNILKNFNVFIDGRGYAGKAEEITLPKLTKKIEEYRGAGMSAPIDIDMGLEKLEMDITFADYDEELFKLWGATNGSEIQFTIRGALQGTSAAIPVIVNVTGYLKEMESGSWKAGEKSTLKCSLSCNYYKLTINNAEIIEIDPINMVNKVNGIDTLSEIRSILQV